MLKQKMLHILTIAVRQIMYAFAFAIKNSKKGGNLVIILGFPHFVF